MRPAKECPLSRSLDVRSGSAATCSATVSVRPVRKNTAGCITKMHCARQCRRRPLELVSSRVLLSPALSAKRCKLRVCPPSNAIMAGLRGVTIPYDAWIPSRTDEDTKSFVGIAAGGLYDSSSIHPRIRLDCDAVAKPKGLGPCKR